MTLTVNSDLNGESPQFTLTCISTGGPATNVTWTRNSVTAMGDAVTVLDDAETATYTHTLTVTGRLEGVYICTVENGKPSNASTSLRVQGKISMALQLYRICACIDLPTVPALVPDLPPLPKCVHSGGKAYKLSNGCGYIATIGKKTTVDVTWSAKSNSHWIQ